MSTALYTAIFSGVITVVTAALSVWLQRQNLAKPQILARGKIVIEEAADIFNEWLRSVGTLVEERRERHAPRGLLVDLFMPPDRAEDALYNLLGRYDYWVEVHGVRWARIIFYLQSAGSIVTFWTDWAMKRLKLLKTFVSS
jgi:hypothetical protein